MTDGGQITFGNPGYLTPTDIPTDTGCRSFQIPASAEWYGLFMAAVLTLTNEWNWSQSIGGIEVGDAAAKCWEIINAAYEQAETGSCSPDVPAPYWDDGEDIDAEEPVEMQPWYGLVTDIFAPPDGLTFEENLSIWLLTGFIALSGEVGAALFFHSIAPRFVLAWKREDIGEIFRVVVDSADYGTVDTTAASPGDIVNLTVLADPALDGHDIYIIKTM